MRILLLVLALVFMAGCASEPISPIERGSPKARDGSSTPLRMEKATEIADKTVSEREGWPQHGEYDHHGVWHAITGSMGRIDNGGWKLMQCKFRMAPGGKIKLEDDHCVILTLDKHGAVTSYTRRKLVKTPQGLRPPRE